MTLLRTGHQVLVWDTDTEKKEKGIYLFNDGDWISPHFALICENMENNCFAHAELDPRATAFLSGDTVEIYVPNRKEWVTGKYIGYDHEVEAHVVKAEGLTFRDTQCRYPSKTHTLTIVSREKTTTLEIPKGSYLRIDGKLLTI